MELNINRYKYQKVLDTEFKVKLPEEVTYLFEYGIRRSIKVIPEWTTWNEEDYQKPEEIWKYEFIIVYSPMEGCKVYKTSIQVSQIQRIYDVYNQKDPSPEYRLIDFVSTYDTEHIRTEEEFKKDLESVLKQITI